MHSHTVTLDPGGFVVRDPAGAAVAVYAARYKAQGHADRLNGADTAWARLFTPVDVMPGQLGFGDGAS